MKDSSIKEIEQDLISARNEILTNLNVVFKDMAIESHVFGSIARGDPDAYSDIDIWFTFDDADYEEIYKDRFKYYSQIGNIIHSCEAPQNAPIGGVHTALLIKTEQDDIVVIDIYLCPLSTAYITEEGKKMFGVDLPKGTIGYNPQKIKVDENYRIDFFIGFVFNSIKKLARNKEKPLESVLYEYQNKFIDSHIVITPIDSKDQNIATLEKIIEGVYKISNDRQKETLAIIRNFARKILT